MSISVVDFIHDYFGVDYYIVFDVARHKASALAIEMEQIIKRETRPLSSDAPLPKDV